MAGGHMKYRHLSRSSSHRQALLRNLVTSLFRHESIATTWHKAKEAQPLAEKLITLGKKNTAASRRRAHQIFFEPLQLVPKLFGPIRERYANRAGGYTRILRIEPMKEDQAESAILELVDGPRDMHFAMTAKTLATLKYGAKFTPAVEAHIKKATQFRKNGVRQLREMVTRMRYEQKKGADKRILAPPRSVYPDRYTQRDAHFYEDVDDYVPPNPLRKKVFQRKVRKRLPIKPIARKKAMKPSQQSQTLV